MTLPRLVCCVLGIAFSLRATPGEVRPSAAGLLDQLRQLSLDQKETYHVRDLHLVRGDIKIYLTEGILSFFKPVDGRSIAALFTTEAVDAGDAEVILMPPQRSERASLASFTRSPNLDEHFSSAVFFFTDDTLKEVFDQIRQAPPRHAPELASDLAKHAERAGRTMAEQLEVRLVEALLDNHAPSEGFFYAVVAGTNLGTFDVLYDPAEFEPISMGRAASSSESEGTGEQHFQLWTNFRSRHARPFQPPGVRIRNYRIDTTIHPDLTVAARAELTVKASAQDGRVLPFGLSTRLKVTAATLDGKPAEILQRHSTRLTEFGSSGTFLLISGIPLTPGVEYNVELQYEGSVIHKTAAGDYFVDDRNTWYPASGPVLTDFDLTFHCPEHLRLVSTGELIQEKTENGIRTVHRKTVAPAALAGFNLGEYSVARDDRGLYNVEVYSQNAAASFSDPSLPEQTAGILADYTKLWQPLPIRSVAVSPIAGYFGQGFPGLIYLSTVSYMKQEDRPAALRNPRLDAFFTNLLLSHEIAHQWWGNIVRQANYRSGWLTEAMANDSALEYIARTRGVAARDEILESYRQDLLHESKGRTDESAGPVDFGERLIDTNGLNIWHIITYEKGSWILHMLRERLGEENFRAMQIRMLQVYAAKPISNEDFRQLASSFVPAGQPDRSLEAFFDTWVYGTGIPEVTLHQSGRTLDVELSHVDDDFITDLPLRCKGTSGSRQTRWIRAGAGDNIINLSNGSSGCELPSLRSYLYTSAAKRH